MSTTIADLLGLCRFFMVDVYGQCLCHVTYTSTKMFHILATNYIQLDWTPSRNTGKINLPTNQKGYDDSVTTVEKLSAKRIQIVWYIFCDHFLKS